jgi:hypothetical protein
MIYLRESNAHGNGTLFMTKIPVGYCTQQREKLNETGDSFPADKLSDWREFTLSLTMQHKQYV